MTDELTAEDALSLTETAFSTVLRDAIAASGLTLSSLSERLRTDGNPVSISTLSYWRSGARTPEGATSLAAVTELERLLALAPGELTALIVPPARTGSLKPPEASNAAMEPRFAELRAKLRAPERKDVRDLASTHTVYTGAEGTTRVIQRRVVQAVNVPMTEVAFVLATRGEVPFPAPLETTDMVGATFSRAALSADGRVSACVLSLESPVLPGDTTLVEMSQSIPPGIIMGRQHVVAMTRRVRETLLVVRFIDGYLPDVCEAFTDQDPTGYEVAIRGGTAHLLQHDYGPGTAGLRWF